MKKRYLVLFLCLFFLFPFILKADDVSLKNFYVQITVLENGDLRVQELMEVSGKVNGMDRNIQYAAHAPSFNGSLSSFEYSDLYNGTGIILNEVKAIDVSSNTTYDTLFEDGKKMNKVSSASVGDDLKYTIKNISNGISIRAFHPSKNKKTGIYLDYTIKGAAVKHNDSAEVYYSFLNNQFNDPVEHMEIHLVFQDKTSLLRGWGHGPLYGDVTLKDNEIWYTATNLDANTKFEIRALFDTTLLNESAKKSNVDAIDKVVQVETNWANEANAEREKEYAKIESNAKYYVELAEETIDRDDYNKAVKWTSYLKEGDLKTELLDRLAKLEPKIKKKEWAIRMTGITASILWLAALIGIFIWIYRKYDKEYTSTFKGDYYRDFPTEDGPEIVDYLMNKKIDYNDLSASLMNLICKKYIKYEVVKNKEYILSYEGTKEELETLDLTKNEKYLMEWLFFDLFKEQKFNLKELQNKAKSGYQTFVNKIQKWKSMALADAMSRNFYESHNFVRIIGILVSLAGILLIMIQVNCLLPSVVCIITFLLAFIGIIYFATFQKRTKEANEDYVKWKGLRKFLYDFGNFGPKELPEIILWEKYLVYAMVFGCAKKLAKTMQIKVNEMYPNGEVGVDLAWNVNQMYTMLAFQNIIQSSVNQAVQTAVSEVNVRTGGSNTSSGGGFGGGFSGGGGGFSGGGGGGGHF